MPVRGEERGLDVGRERADVGGKASKLAEVERVLLKVTIFSVK